MLNNNCNDAFMKKTSKEKVESFYNESFKNVIKIIHLKNKTSLNQMGKDCGVSRKTITSIAKLLDLKIRNHKQSVEITKNKGERHYAFGQTKETHKKHLISSSRMKKHNAINAEGAKEKRAETIASTFKKKLYPQEIKFKKTLSKLKIKFIMQFPVGPYNLDFYIKNKNIAIEIDSTSKWGIKQKQFAKERDEYVLEQFNIKTIRINKTKLDDIELIKEILKKHSLLD